MLAAVRYGTTTTTSNSTRNTKNELGHFQSSTSYSRARVTGQQQVTVYAAPASQHIKAGQFDQQPSAFILELADLCDAIDQDLEAEAAAAAAAASKRAVKHQFETRLAGRADSPASSGLSEASSSSSLASFLSHGSADSVAPPFGQTWLPDDQCPLKRVTKKEPAKLRPLTLMNVWVVDVPAQHTVAVFDFCRRNDMHSTEAGHLKRVRRSRDGNFSSILLKPKVVDDAEGRELAALLASDPALASLVPLAPYVKAVPSSYAESTEQLAQWGELWPISFIPMHAGPRARSLPKRWTEHHLAWVRKGMDRVVELAQQAKSNGELPIACMVSESYDLAIDPIEQPSPLELASHHDTRTSTGNTLCHAFRNLIAAVADIDKRGLRQGPRTPPTARGATLPYLLTGMTLFTSHEPCLLCSMALLHSRVQTIIYAIPADGAGGCGSVYDVHEDEGLNHKFEAWQLLDVEGLEVVEVDP